MPVLHTGDIGAILWINVTENGAPLDALLSTFTTRTVRLRRPRTCELVTITDVPIALDAADSLLKLQVRTGTNAGLSLTGLGGFVLDAANWGVWRAEVQLGDGTWLGTSDQFELANVQQVLQPCVPAAA